MKNCRVRHTQSGYDVLMNPDTGELQKVARVKLAPSDLNYIKLFKPQEGVYEMRPREMKLATIHVWDYLCIRMDKDNMAIVTTDEICEATKYGPASVARAKVQLQDMGHIIRRASNIYMLNPDIVALIKDRTKLFLAWQNLKAKLRDKAA